MHTSLMTLKNITLKENQQTILKDLNLMVEPNEQVGIKMTLNEMKSFEKLFVKNPQVFAGDFINDNQVQVLTNEDGLYDNSTVKNYLRLFADISGNSVNIEQFFLNDVLNQKISKLNIDQKMRLHLMRIYLLQPNILVSESPLNQMSNEGIRLYLKALSFLRSNNITVIFLSNYLEELSITSQTIYRYNVESGIERINMEIDEDDQNTATEAIAPTQIMKISAKINDKTVFFSPEEIDFIESINGISNIRIGEESFKSNLTLSDLENKLTSFGFFRCHRSYLVNLQRIAELVSYSRNSYTLILKNNVQSKLPLSRTKLDELRKLIEL